MINKNIETLFTEYEYLIGNTIRRNRPLLAALRLDEEDVKQDLSITMLSAIENFNPKLSESLVVHIKCRLQYEILNMKRNYRPHGITGVPKGERIESLYLDSTPCIYENEGRVAA